MKNAWRNVKLGAQNVLPSVLRAKKIVIFDCETTGVSPKKDKIIQFSAVLYRIEDDLSLVPIEEFDQYINPGYSLPEKIVEITGITDDMLKYYQGEEVYVKQIFNFLNKGDIWAAYNAPFDTNMLKGMSERTSVPLLFPYVLDVLPMARDIIPKTELENHKLETVTKYLFPDKIFQFHSAIDDVQATGMILDIFLHYYMECMNRPEDIKVRVHMEWASLFINPRQKSQQRIKVNIDKDKSRYGFIFWDVINKCWSCMSSKEAKKLFDSVDLADLERQVLARYGTLYQATDMETLGRNWTKAKRNKEPSA